MFRAHAPSCPLRWATSSSTLGQPFKVNPDPVGFSPLLFVGINLDGEELLEVPDPSLPSPYSYLILLLLHPCMVLHDLVLGGITGWYLDQILMDSRTPLRDLWSLKTLDSITPEESKRVNKEKQTEECPPGEQHDLPWPHPGLKSPRSALLNF